MALTNGMMMMVAPVPSCANNGQGLDLEFFDDKNAQRAYGYGRADHSVHVKAL